MFFFSLLLFVFAGAAAAASDAVPFRLLVRNMKCVIRDTKYEFILYLARIIRTYIEYNAE